ncbi:Nif3-like dinuclear metal center hexameric protein [Alkaliphilus pronyensis]|nr:Nif3-like dinuclear metal center hexameric protein [Alkaliphilus pronyensis]
MKKIGYATNLSLDVIESARELGVDLIVTLLMYFNNTKNNTY